MRCKVYNNGGRLELSSQTMNKELHDQKNSYRTHEIDISKVIELCMTFCLSKTEFNVAVSQNVVLTS